MATPFYIKTSVDKNGITSIRLAISHPMESGYRQDAKGKFVPAWFIQTVSVKTDDRLLLDAQLGPHVAKNPIIAFKTRNLPMGSKLQIEWTDNKGSKDEYQAQVS